MGTSPSGMHLPRCGVLCGYIVRILELYDTTDYPTGPYVTRLAASSTFSVELMEPQAFVAEFYRRLFNRSAQARSEQPLMPLDDYMRAHADAFAVIERNYRPLLPNNREAAILDIGYGEGYFLAACVNWGYTNLSGIEYSSHRIQQLNAWGVHSLHQVEGSVEEFLARSGQQFDVIHASHLIEHVPKYNLLDTVDALFAALKPGGRVVLITPNMNSPTALRSRYITLGHEWGFIEQSLRKLLLVGGFDDIAILPVSVPPNRPKLVLGNVLRWLTVQPMRWLYRLYGGADTRLFSESIIGVGTRPAQVVDPVQRTAAQAPQETILHG